MKTKLSIIGCAGVPARYGGFETLAHHLVLNLSDKIDLTVYNSSKCYPKEQRVKNWQGANIKYLPISANGKSSILYDAFSILQSAFHRKDLLILGVSGCFILPLIKLFTGIHITVNIDGLEWKRNKWNSFAKKFLKWSEAMAVKFADTIVTDNKVIQQYVKDEYNYQSKLITYGADHVNHENIDETQLKNYPFLKNDYAFKVCRIEPENNVHIILEAFSKSSYPLVLVGNWEHSKYGTDLKMRYENYSNLSLLDPIYDQKKLNILRSNAAVYIHGHSAGGTNPSLIEAMYLGLPIISFDVAYNKATTNGIALYFGNDLELIEILREIKKLPLNWMGEKLKEYAIQNYTWENISNAYSSIYKKEENKIEFKNFAKAL